MIIKNLTCLVFGIFLSKLKNLKLNFDKNIKNRNMTLWNKNMKLILNSTLVVSLLFSCTEEKKVEISKEKKSYCLDEQFTLETAHPKRQLMINEIPLSGSVEPNPDNVIHFSNLVNGIIVGTSFSLGDYVKKGQVLAKVKSTELSEWKSKQRILASQLTVAKHEYKAIQSMYDDGIASMKQLNQAASDVVSLESELEEVSSNLQLYNASPETGVFLIKAPSSGYITEKNITQGMHVSAYNESLFTISELNEVWVQINVYASNLQSITEGMEVTIRSLSYPDITFTGKIDALSHVLDSESRVIKARVTIQNKDLLLKPGMFVDVMAKQVTDKEVLTIPTSALIFDNNQNYVVIYEDACNLKTRKVEYIGQINGTCYISDDLSTNEEIIVKDHLLIYEQIKNFKNID